MTSTVFSQISTIDTLTADTLYYEENSPKIYEETPQTTNPSWEGEGTRFVTDAPVFDDFRKHAAGGTAAFFIGVGIDIASVPLSIAISDDPSAPFILLIPSVITGVCKMAGVPVACGYATAAADEYTRIMGSSPDNNCWKFYSFGWLCYGVGNALNLFGNLGKTPELSLVGSVIGLGGDILWSVACIRAGAFIRELRDKTQESNAGISWQIAPIVTPQGQLGVGVSGRF